MTAVSVISIPAIILATVGIVFAIYFFLYKRNINKALNGEYQKHTKMPGVGSMGSSLVTIGLILLIIFNYFHINSLQNDLENMQMKYSNSLHHLRTDLSNLELEIKKANSLLASFNMTLNSYDLDTRTATFELQIVPKDFNDNTNIFMSLGNDSVSFSKDSANIFKGYYDADIFGFEYYEPIVTISDGDRTKTETLEGIDFSYIWQKVLPYIDHEGFINHGSYSFGELDIEGVLDVFATSNNGYTFTSGKIIFDKNGKTISTIDFEIKNDTKENIEINKSLDVDKDDNVKVYLIATDSAGYTHKCLVYEWMYDEEGIYSIKDLEEIYDKAGNLLTSFDY